MATLEIEGTELAVRLSLLEQFGALSRGPRVPIEAIADVRAVPSAWQELRGLRAPGTGWPGRIALGTWRGTRYKDFCAVYGKGPGVVVDLNGASWARFVVSTDDPDAVAAGLTAVSV
jgi:hypothetical protein